MAGLNGIHQIPESHCVCLSRLAHEMDLLVDMSLGLQSGIHTLDLSNCDPQTRKVLQSADALTQTLMCVRSVLEYLSNPRLNSGEAVFGAALGGVFLEDVHDRLLSGKRANQTSSADVRGHVDFF